MKLWLKSSPGFREKLAERVESTPLRRELFHIDFLNSLNFRTIRINHAKLGWTEPQVVESYQVVGLNPS